ncbi:MAG TPA: SMP-30/gluconolactonase/LRE family protein [Micropepsaceae bacterium]|nr:SMP-30/gluconolactonase/LRE family protein [Micropepsaceae bacterium]
MPIREVASGLKFPEGPVVMADGSVIVVEIAAGQVTRITPKGKKEVVAKTGGGPNGAAIGPDGALYVCNNGGFEWHKRGGLLFSGHKPADYSGGRIERIDLSTGKVELLYTHCNGRPLRGPNDLVFDTKGGFWFTDFAKSTRDHREWGALYYAKADGSHISMQIHQIMAPNGVGLSPDERTVYYAETLSGRLYAAKIAKPGQLAVATGQVPGGAYVGQPAGRKMFDSLAVQENGDVCVATLLEAGISTITPKGKVTFTDLKRFKDPLVTNIAFGGKGMKTAFITLSCTGKLIAMDWPKAGLPLAFGA